MTPRDHNEARDAEGAAKFEDHAQVRRQLRGKKNKQECTAFKEPVVQSFLKLWKEDDGMFGVRGAREEVT